MAHERFDAEDIIAVFIAQMNENGYDVLEIIFAREEDKKDGKQGD